MRLLGVGCGPRLQQIWRLAGDCISATLNLLCKTHQRPPPAPHAPPECSGQASAARWGLRGRRAWPVARPYLAAASCSWAARGPVDARNLHQAGQSSPRASPGHGDARGTVRGGLQRARGGDYLWDHLPAALPTSQTFASNTVRRLAMIPAHGVALERAR